MTAVVVALALTGTALAALAVALRLVDRAVARTSDLVPGRELRDHLDGLRAETASLAAEVVRRTDR